MRELLWGDGESSDTELADHAWRLSLRTAELADIDFAGRRVLRSIRFVVRDHDWRTADTIVTATGHLEDVQRWLRGVCCFDGRPVVAWEARLGLGAGLRLTVRARVIQEFERNRIGLIVLHGPELAGVPVEIRHSDLTREHTTFPVDIAPHQPARDVAGYRWQVDDVDCELRLSGDVFEMEDQRNWTDASYKTYSTPLELPFPVSVRAGNLIEQSLELTCRHHAAAINPASMINPAAVINRDPPGWLVLTPTAPTLPALQLAASTAPLAGLSGADVDHPAGVDHPADVDHSAGVDHGRPDHRQHGGHSAPAPTILVEVPADETCWRDVIERAGRDAAGAPLDVRIIADRPAQVAPVIAALADVAVVRIAVYERQSSKTTAELLIALQSAIHDQRPGIEVVAGTRAHFTELNRTIADFAHFGGALTFSITAQMHDRSRAQVIESLPMQRTVAEQAVRMAAGRGIHLGPVTLRPRFNAVATTAFVADDHGPIDTDGYGAQQVAEATDPRQTAPGLAAWTVCSIAALAVPGVHSLTYYETWGPRGIRSAPPDRADHGLTYPVGDVWQWILADGLLVPPPVIEVESVADRARGVTIGMIAQRSRDRHQVLIANPGPDPVRVALADDAAAMSWIGSQPQLDSTAGTTRIGIAAATTVRLRLG